MRLKLSAAAARDAARLYRTSVASFGRIHADRYFDGLEGALQEILAYPDASPVREDLRGLRLRRYEAHHIFYRLAGSEILIVRILHGRQSPAKWT